MIDSVQGASVYTYDTVSHLFTVKNYLVSYSDHTYHLIPDLTSELDWIGSRAYWYVGGYVLPYYGRNVNAIVNVSIDLGELASLVFSESSLSFSKQEAYHVKLQNYRNSKP